MMFHDVERSLIVIKLFASTKQIEHLNTTPFNIAEFTSDFNLISGKQVQEVTLSRVSFRKEDMFCLFFVFLKQAGDIPFNRALLFNIGFKEALKFNQYDCFIFHDVDLIPEDDRNEYSCPTSPRHMSVAVDKFRYRQVSLVVFNSHQPFSFDKEQDGKYTDRFIAAIAAFKGCLWPCMCLALGEP